MCSIMGYLGSFITADEFSDGFIKSIKRGPDMSAIKEVNDAIFGFHRLAIMGLSPEGMQPFFQGDNMVVCNGEIYGFRVIREQLKQKGYTFVSESDCEILLPMYQEHGIDMFAMLEIGRAHV